MVRYQILAFDEQLGFVDENADAVYTDVLQFVCINTHLQRVHDNPGIVQSSILVHI